MPIRYFFQTRIIAGLVLLCANTVLFASPALNSFMQQVWEKNPNIQAIEAAVEAAKARKQAANQPIYNPEMDVELERSDINTLSFGISQSVDWGNKRTASSHISDAELQMAIAELDIQRYTLAEEILNTLIGLETTFQLQKLAQQRVVLMEEFTANTEKRQTAGDVGLQDVALAQVALSEAQMQLARSQAQQAENEARIQSASGLFVKEWPTLVKEPPALELLNNIDDYIHKLPNVNALKANLAASKSNIALSKAERKADPNFGVKAGMEDGNPLLGLSFSMPLNIRNNYRAEVEVASQEFMQQQQLLLAEIQRARAHINGAYQRYSLTYTAWQSWKKTGIASLKEQMNLIQTIWKSGEMSTSDYLVQAKQNVDAQETAVELSAEMWAAWIEWLAVSGQIEQWIKQTK